MKTTTTLALAGFVLGTGMVLANEHANPDVGGAPMFAERNIVENAVNSADHTTLVAAVQAAGLVDVLQGEGPFTVLAPVNDAFEAPPEGTVEMLLQPEYLATLQQILTCHVIPASVMSGDIMGMIDEADGAFRVTTVGGCEFTLMHDGQTVMIEDGQNRVANVTIADVRQSNGVIHVIDRVLMPAVN